MGIKDAPKTIAIAGDWHANKTYAVAAIEWAKKRGADAIVHVGDFGFHFDEGFLNELSWTLAVNDMELFFVDGNHENFNRLYNAFHINNDGVRELRYNISHLPRGFRWEWHNVSYLALGGAHSVDRQWRREHISWWPEERITAAEEYLACEGGSVDVMFTHDCPMGVDIPGIDDDTSSWIPRDDLYRAKLHRQVLRGVVNEVTPRELYHGHYHTRYDGMLATGRYRTKIHGLYMDGGDFEDNMIIKELA